MKLATKLSDWGARLSKVVEARDEQAQLDAQLREEHAALLAERSRLASTYDPRPVLLARIAPGLAALRADLVQRVGRQVVEALSDTAVIGSGFEVLDVRAGSLAPLAGLPLTLADALAMAAPEAAAAFLTDAVTATRYPEGPPRTELAQRLAEITQRIAEIEEQHAQLAQSSGGAIEDMPATKAKRIRAARVASREELERLTTAAHSGSGDSRWLATLRLEQLERERQAR